MNILYFSPIIWSDLKQRPQHLAEELSKYHTIYYIEPSVSYLSCLFKKNDMFKKRSFRVNDNLTVIRFSGKFRMPKSIEVVDFLGLNNIYEKVKLKKLLNICDIVWLGSPIYYSLINDMHNKKIVYDKMDDYTKLTRNKLLKKVLKKNEDKLIQESDTIFVTCEAFYREIRSKNKSVFIVNNGVSYNFINNKVVNNNIVKELDQLKDRGYSVFGYIGTIDDWFDFETINNIIQYNDKFCVALIGKNNLNNKPKSERVLYYDSVSKEQLSSVIDKFDYCLYPFKKNVFLDTIDPVKIYEYLGLNKKVIAVKSDEMAKFETKIYLYKDVFDLHKILRKINLLKKPFNYNKDLIEFVKNNSWEKRTRFINDKISNFKN